MFDLSNIQSLLLSGKAAGLKIRLLKSGELSLCLVTIQRKKKEIDIVEVEQFSSLEELGKVVNSNIPLLLSIDGKGIIHKQLEKTADEPLAALVGKVLPNAQPKDFYLQKKTLPNDKVWVSMARKELIDPLLQQITDAGWYINDLLLGPFSLQKALPALNENVSPNQLTDEEITMVLDTNEVVKITERNPETLNEKYAVAEKELDARGLIALGSAFQYYFKDDWIERIDHLQITTQTADFFHRRLFKQLGWGVLSVFMATLLINFLFFDHYNSKFNEVSSSVQENQLLLTELKSLKKDLQLKKEFIENSGFTNASRISFYADELAQSLPTSIKLQQLSLNPMQRKRRESEATVFEFNEIQLTGITTKSTELNTWIKNTKSKPWASEVNIIDFNQKKNKAGAIFQLQIKIDKDRV